MADTSEVSLADPGSPSSPGAPMAAKVGRWKIFVTMIGIMSVTLIIMLLFSDTFDTGRHVIIGLLDFGANSWSVFSATMAIALCVYLLDISYWTGSVGKVSRRVILHLLAAALIALGLSMVRELPYMPLACLLGCLPLAALSLRLTALRNNSAGGASWVLGASFLVAGVACLLLWVLWLFGVWDQSYQFWFDNRLKFSQAAQCNTTDFEPAGKVIVDGIPICTAAFLLWLSPFILFGVLLFLGLFLLLLTRMRSRGCKPRLAGPAARAPASRPRCAPLGRSEAAAGAPQPGPVP